MIGLLLYKLSGQRILLIASAVGAILPDLIDKPLGHFLLADSLNAGRIYAHTLLLLLIIVVLGLYYWRKKSNYLLLAAAAGVGSHLLLDQIWQAPVTLFWPLLGPFAAADFEGYFTTFTIKELTSISEWAFALTVIYVLLIVYQDKFKKLNKVSLWFERLLPLPSILLLIMGLAYLLSALFTSNEEQLLVGVVAVLGSLVLTYTLKNKVMSSGEPETAHLNPAKR